MGLKILVKDASKDQSIEKASASIYFASTFHPLPSAWAAKLDISTEVVESASLRNWIPTASSL